MPISTKAVELQKGATITLINAPLYASSEAEQPSNTVNGTYYLYDGVNFNGRVRITNSADKCGNTPVGYYVTGYIDIIAKKLTERGIHSPGGKEKWHRSTILSILQNEKYKGSALLQKSFTTDFLTKKTKKN